MPPCWTRIMRFCRVVFQLSNVSIFSTFKVFIYFHVQYLLETLYHRFINFLDLTIFSSFYPQIFIKYSSVLSSIIVFLMPPLHLNRSAIFVMRMQLRL